MEISNDPCLSFLSWNLYLGADLTPLLTASQDQIPLQATEVFRQFLATNFPVRVKSIAREIDLQKPDLIGLQEAVRWQLEIPNFRVITYDFVQMLLNELQKRGLNYEIAGKNHNVSAEVPDRHGNLVRLLDRDVILIRKEQKLKVIRRKTANFKTNLTIPFGGGQTFEIRRGWSSVDIQVTGHVFRMINTHLEPSAEIQDKQAMEILNGPAKTEIPLIITGDLNSNAIASDTPTYRIFIDSGFRDVWRKVGKGPGYTCCQDSDLLNTVSSLNSRIDFILYKNGWKPIQAVLVGEKLQNLMSIGLWPSDHAGVSARLILKDGCK